MKNWLNRNILLLSWISLLTDIASEMLYPVMPAFLISVGYSAPAIGLLEGFAEAIAGISKGIFGAYSDHSGKRIPFIRTGYLLSTLAKPLLGIFQSVVPVFLLRSADRLGKGIRSSARDAMLADESSDSNRARVFGFHRSMDTLGAVLGPLLALIFLYFFPGKIQSLFLWAALPGLLAVLCLFLLKKNEPGISKSAPFKPLGFLHYFKHATPAYRKLIPVLFVFALVNSSDLFLIMKLRETGMSDFSVVLVYVIYNFVFAALAYPLGILSAKTGMKNLLVAGFIFFGIAYAGIGISGNWLISCLFFGVYGFYAAATDGISKALISRLCDSHEKATAIGFYNSLQSLGSLMAGIITGLLWWYSGPAPALCFSATVAIICAIVLACIKLETASARGKLQS